MSTVFVVIAGGLLALLAARSYFPAPLRAPQDQIGSQETNAQARSATSESTAGHAAEELRLRKHVPEQETQLAKLHADEQRLLGQVSDLRDVVAHLRSELTDVRAQTVALASQPGALVHPKEAEVQSREVTPGKPKSPAAQTEAHDKIRVHRDTGYSGPRHSVRGLLLLARDQLVQGYADRSSRALDSAETKALNNNATYGGEQDPTKSRLVQRIQDAREALKDGEKDEALYLIKLALSGIKVAR